jgi:hypothetical protein
MVQESLFPFCGGLGQLAFLSEATMRSGQQAALGSDLLALLDALKIETAILGYPDPRFSAFLGAVSGALLVLPST